MAKRRTRAQKITALQRRSNLNSTITSNVSEKYEYKTTAKATENRVNYYVSEIPLSLKLISSDLTKSLVVAILALILQFMLATYLNRGGWQQVFPLLQKITSVY